MGYSLNGVCYAGADEVLAAFKQLYPMVAPDGYTYIEWARFSDNGPGDQSIDFKTVYRNLNAVSVVARSHASYVLLGECNAVSPNVMQNLNALLPVALVVFFLTFFFRKAVRKAAHFAGGMQSDF